MDKTGGIGKRMHRATIDHNFRTGRTEITELYSIQDHAPKIKKGDMRKFDGKDPVNWIL